jgi:hypothetical protein
MPRRGGGRRSSSGLRQRKSTLPAERPSSSMTRQQPQQVTQNSRPGLFGQFASTAAGVAVGHAMGEALVGSVSGGSDAPTHSPY